MCAYHGYNTLINSACETDPLAPIGCSCQYLFDDPHTRGKP